MSIRGSIKFTSHGSMAKIKQKAEKINIIKIYTYQKNIIKIYTHTKKIEWKLIKITIKLMYILYLLL